MPKAMLLVTVAEQKGTWMPGRACSFLALVSCHWRSCLSSGRALGRLGAHRCLWEGVLVAGGQFYRLRPRPLTGDG